VGIEPSMVNRPPRAVLFDRDGTLVRDVPYNGDPARVEPMPTALAATALLRRHGIAIGVITNQSGVARGLLSPADVAAVNDRVEELLGPMDVWAICPHGVDEGCGCRKPAPGLVIAALHELGLRPSDAVVIGDIGSDVEAARAAGSEAVLVPTPVTRDDEVRSAPLVAATVLAAVELVLVAERPS
jgi:D-glycero-D-manno-heptose 1,7-bisphosphate phosphatase